MDFNWSWHSRQAFMLRPNHHPKLSILTNFKSKLFWTEGLGLRFVSEVSFMCRQDLIMKHPTKPLLYQPFRVYIYSHRAEKYTFNLECSLMNIKIREKYTFNLESYLLS